MPHCYEREVSRIVEAVFDGFRVHFQGPKLHALIYRPIDDGEGIATRAALLQLALRDFMSNVFNEAFPLYTDFAWASGSDLGEAIGTKNGQHGQRELLFVGPPANYAAKLVATGSRLSSNVHARLPQNMKDLCTASGGAYRIAAPKSKLDELLAEHGIVWDRTKSRGRIEQDRDSVTLDEIE
jgi:class 3 adenylate cyclase